MGGLMSWSCWAVAIIFVFFPNRGYTFSLQATQSNCTENSFKYQGIRYATAKLFEKPVGPEPYIPSESSLFGAPCPQEGHPNNSINCLTLDVYSPFNVSDSPAERYPVMIYIHGGGHEAGSSSRYPAAGLSSCAGVVVVVINYRLGAFGFLSSGDSLLPGNFGLWDQNMAFQWVAGNIARFGGDPDSVTIFGQSSGAGDVMLHAATKRFTGKTLFHRVISQSGSAWVDRSPQGLFRSFVSSIGCLPADSDNTNVVPCLKSKTSEEVFRASLSFSSWGPVLDSSFIYADVYDALEGKGNLDALKNFKSVDAMFGYNSQEMALAAPRTIRSLLKNPKFNISQGLTANQAKEVVVSILKSDQGFSADTAEYVYNSLEGIHFRAEATPKERVLLLIKMLGSLRFKLPIFRLARLHSGSQSGASTLGKTFMYEYDYRSAGTPPLWYHTGVAHSGEVQLVLGRPFTDDNSTAEDKSASTLAMFVWSQFAEIGQPGGGIPEFTNTSLVLGRITGTEIRIEQISNSTIAQDALLQAARENTPPQVPSVTVNSTTFLGTQMISYNDSYCEVYKGIRYAKAARFERPVAYELPKEYDASEFGAACPQRVRFPQNGPMLVTSEDCLFLNVYVPPNTNGLPRSLPVMIWIHGGGFTGGSGGAYDPRMISYQGNVIVVTINYRLNVFGFLTTSDEVLEPNLGLWDQHMSIKWVHQYISGFDGDPKRVTIFGGSAGSISSLLQGISPHNGPHLFQRIIAQSGVPKSWPTLSVNENAVFDSFVTKVGCSNADYFKVKECLRNVPENEMALASPDIFQYSQHGDFLSNSALMVTPEEWEKLQQYDLFIGANSQEGLLFISFYGLEAMKGENGASEEDFDSYIRKYLPSLSGEGASKAVVKSLIKNQYISSNNRDRLTKMVDFTGDYNMVYPSFFAAQAHAKGNNGTSTHLYTFDYNGGTVAFRRGPSWLKTGTDHSEEVRYVFGYPLQNWDGGLAQYADDSQRRISEEVLTYWNNFVVTGNPVENVFPTVPSTSGFPRLNINGVNSSMGSFSVAAAAQEAYKLSLGSMRDYIENITRPTYTVRPLTDVNTTVGMFRGNRSYLFGSSDKFVDKFYGIRYAKPPKRFEPPVSLDEDSSQPVYEATELPNACFLPLGSEVLFSGKPIVNQSEDCLFLNIYVPPRYSDDELPVMVYIHGGSYSYGSSAELDPSVLSNFGKTIVVSINYRLGAFGFLSTGTPALPGNLGLWDQRMALHWVHDHIRQFGGDPGRVTIFGVSAGASSVNAHIMSEKSSHLFHRALMESGALGASWAHDKIPNKSYTEFVASVACDVASNQTEIECMKRLDAETLRGDGTISFAPVVDGIFLTETPEQFMQLALDNRLDKKRSGRLAAMQFVFGLNSQETLAFWNMSIYRIPFNESVNRWVVPLYVSENNVRGAAAIQSTVYEFYSNKFNFSGDMETTVAKLEMTADVTIGIPIMQMADALSRLTDQVFFYEFDYYPYITPTAIDAGGTPPKEIIRGSAHLDELLFVFGATHAPTLGMISIENSAVEDKKLAEVMMTYWGNFADTGTPNGNGRDRNLPRWKPFQSPQNYHNALQLTRVSNIRNEAQFKSAAYDLYNKVLPAMKFIGALVSDPCVSVDTSTPSDSDVGVSVANVDAATCSQSKGKYLGNSLMLTHEQANQWITVVLVIACILFVAMVIVVFKCLQTQASIKKWQGKESKVFDSVAGL